MIEENVKKLLAEIPERNAFGERVTLVAAVKMQTVEDINSAICAGVHDIGDNHVQEFRDKYDGITKGVTRHFIGHLQTNKIKYLLGKVDLYHSVDRFNLAEELSKKSAEKGVISNILIQINAGNEETKGGFDFDGIDDVCKTISLLPYLKVKGLMAMLPNSDDEQLLKQLATKMRQTYDRLKATYGSFEYLSMGMSGDWKLCVECGSNMIRLGTSIFGQRNYNK
jgi:hypothetical protein